jgi:hypothetical protein
MLSNLRGDGEHDWGRTFSKPAPGFLSDLQKFHYGKGQSSSKAMKNRCWSRTFIEHDFIDSELSCYEVYSPVEGNMIGLLDLEMKISTIQLRPVERTRLWAFSLDLIRYCWANFRFVSNTLSPAARSSGSIRIFVRAVWKPLNLLNAYLARSDSEVLLFEHLKVNFIEGSFSFSVQWIRRLTEYWLYRRYPSAMNPFSIECECYRQSVAMNQFPRESSGSCEGFIWLRL